MAFIFLIFPAFYLGQIGAQLFVCFCLSFFQVVVEGFDVYFLIEVENEFQISSVDFIFLALVFFVDLVLQRQKFFGVFFDDFFEFFMNGLKIFVLVKIFPVVVAFNETQQGNLLVLFESQVNQRKHLQSSFH